MKKNNDYTKQLIEGQFCLFSDIFDTTSKITFIIIPGNPSIAELYIPFGNLLKKKFNYPFIISSLISNDLKEYSLKKCIELKKNFFEYLSKINPKGKYIIIGHSIGCYILINALKNLKNINNFIGIYCIFPALQNLYNCFPFIYKVITFNYFIINILSFLNKILKILPLYLIILIFKFFSDIPSNYIKNILDNVDYSSIKQILFLAKDEGKYIKGYNNDLLEFMNKISNKLRMIYGKNDRYGNEEIAKKFKKIVPGVNIKIVNILHAFVLGYSQNIFEEIKGMINNDLINNIDKSKKLK